jgi:hypothetical protein
VQERIQGIRNSYLDGQNSASQVTINNAEEQLSNE